MSSTVKGITLTNVVHGLYDRMTEQAIIRDVCNKYDVVSVVRDFQMSSARKMELFLLGAVFMDREIIMNVPCDVMIMHKVMYILDIKEG